MRIWDIPPARLCRKHLLAEHRELHGVWTILTEGKKAYANHPETLRWKGKLKALYLRHEALVEEMSQRGYHYASPLPVEQATGDETQTEFVDSVEKQIALLKKKGCGCRV